MSDGKKVLLIVGAVVIVAVIVLSMIFGSAVFDIFVAAVIFVGVIISGLMGLGNGSGGRADVPVSRPRSRMSCCRSCGYIGVGRSYCIKCGSTWLEPIDW